jgi:hypothetical protein
MTDPSHRVSDADREQAVVRLRDDLLAGRLTEEEFAARVETAYRAKTGTELVRVRAELPDAPAARAASRRRPARITPAIFGHVERRGRLRLGRRSVAASLFADIDLDLREATIDGDETTIAVAVVFGNVDIYVPEGVDVDVAGLTIFGQRREWGKDVVDADAPTVHVRILGCFGTVDVWRVPRDLRGTYRELIKELRAGQRQLPA